MELATGTTLVSLYQPPVSQQIYKSSPSPQYCGLLVEEYFARRFPYQSKKEWIAQIKNGDINGKIVLLITENPNAKAIDFAKKNNINFEILNKKKISDSKKYEDLLLKILQSYQTDLIVLAGYLKMIPLKEGDFFDKRKLKKSVNLINKIFIKN